MEYTKGQVDDILAKARAINARATNITRKTTVFEVPKNNLQSINIQSLNLNRVQEILNRAKAINSRISSINPISHIRVSPNNPVKVMAVSAESGELEEFKLLFTKEDV